MSPRPLQPSDSERLLAFWNRSAPFDPMTPELLQEKVWGDHDYDPALALACKTERCIAGFVMAVVRHQPTGRIGYVKLIAVAPEHRRRGLGTSLLDVVEDRLFAEGLSEVRVAESAPNYLTPGVDERCGELRRRLEGRGYEPFDESINMTVALRGNPLVERVKGLETAIGFQVVRHRQELEDAVDQLLAANWPAWQAEYAAAACNDPPTALIALKEGRAIGFAAYDGNNRGMGWFGPMGTAPAARGRGVGRALLMECLEDMARAGYDGAIVPWVGPTEFYAKIAGARVSRRFVRYRKRRSQHMRSHHGAG